MHLCNWAEKNGNIMNGNYFFRTEARENVKTFFCSIRSMDEHVANVGKAWTTQPSSRANNNVHEVHPPQSKRLQWMFLGQKREDCCWDHTCGEICIQFGRMDALQNIKTLRVDANMAVTDFFLEIFKLKAVVRITLTKADLLNVHNGTCGKIKGKEILKIIGQLSIFLLNSRRIFTQWPRDHF